MKAAAWVLVAVAAGGALVAAEPPEPEEGYRWVINAAYSDEFDGTELDRSKWNNYFTMGWKGREPAAFEPSTVSVGGGLMRIRNSMLAKPRGNFTIAGGAVTSIKQTAHFGYYECNLKASRISMSTTFWMSNKKVKVNQVTKKSEGKDCPKDSFSQELDIVEAIGGEFNSRRSAKFRTDMNFNTHYRYVSCAGGKEKFYSAGNNAVEGNGKKAANARLSSESWEDFHTYGAHWKDENEVSFFADDRAIGSVKVRTDVVDKPFTRPMGINMVTETYNWARPVPTPEQLSDPSISTSYYNWIRSYELVKVDGDQGDVSYPGVYKETLKHYEDPVLVRSGGNQAVRLSYVYKANRDLNLRVFVYSQDWVLLAGKTFRVYRGYGKHKKVVDLGKDFSAKGGVRFYTELRDDDFKWVAHIGEWRRPTPAPTTAPPTPTLPATPTPTPTNPATTTVPATPTPTPAPTDPATPTVPATPTNPATTTPAAATVPASPTTVPATPTNPAATTPTPTPEPSEEQYDWSKYPVPAEAGEGEEWELQGDMSDEFNYAFRAVKRKSNFGDKKWYNFYHNRWNGPGTTYWQHDHVAVHGGDLVLRASRKRATATPTSRRRST